MGLTGFGDPFSDPSADDAGPALELAAVVVPTAVPSQAAPAPESPAALLARKVAELSGYGPPPQKLLQSVPYFFRVASRKRELIADLSQITIARMRLEQRADDALCALGEALYARRFDPKLGALAAQFKLVAQTREQIGETAAASKRGFETRQREISAVAHEIDAVRAKAAPVEARAAGLKERIERGRGQLRELEQAVQRAETEQNALKSSTQPSALEQIRVLEQQRSGLRGQMQSINVELLPLQEDLSGLQAQLAKHAQAVEQLQTQQQKLSEAADRDEQRQRIAQGGAAAANRDVLRALVAAAVRQRLTDSVHAALEASTAAHAPIPDKRQEEALLRKAMNSYDSAAYTRGKQLAAASVIGTFLLFVLLIVF